MWLAVTLPESLAGAFAIVLAAALTAWGTYKAAVARVKVDAAKVATDASSAHQASVDTTATAQAFDTTVRALAGATAEANQRAITAEATAKESLAANRQCVAEFAAHRAATDAEIATLRGALSDLAERLAPGSASGARPATEPG